MNVFRYIRFRIWCHERDLTPLTYRQWRRTWGDQA